jgi:hypothetical protein
MLLALIILILLFFGGGYGLYSGGSYGYRGVGLGTILIIVLIVPLLTGRL